VGGTIYQGEIWILDPPEGVCPGQARFEYPADGGHEILPGDGQVAARWRT